MQVAKLISGAGGGKTTELLNLLERNFQDYAPEQIAFSSYTRAACGEAVRRASDRFDIPAKQLENDGWFKTCHAICKKAVGLDGVIGNDKEGKEWLSSAIQAEVELNPEEGSYGKSNEQKALSVWEVARQRLEPFQDAWLRAWRATDSFPPDYFCRAVIERYEQMKRLDGRTDFCDMLTLFAGKSCSIDGYSDIMPAGNCPQLKCLFLDEQQDNSAVMQLCFKRLAAQDTVERVYIAADPFQSINGYSGGDPHWFNTDWPVYIKKILPKSWRCAVQILDFGERILSGCSDYFDRKIAPADHDGEVRSIDFDPAREDTDELTSLLDPAESWLLLARTNWQAQTLGRVLDAAGVPWVGTKDIGSIWNSPVRNAAILAFLSLEKGAPINGKEWQQILKNINNSIGDQVLLVRGTKARFDDLSEYEAENQFSWVTLAEIGQLGGTPALQEIVAGGGWREWIKGTDRVIEAVERWGLDGLVDSKIKIGTVHSAKGMEADNVAVLTSVTSAVNNGMESVEGRDEEARVAYVAVTRARKRLLLLNEYRPRFEWELPL